MASQSSLESRLKERNESRKAALEQRRAEREAGQRHEETADYYIQEFARKKAAIVELLESAGTLPKDKLTAHFDHVSEELQSLKKFVSDSTVFLTSFDLKSSQQVSRLDNKLITQCMCGIQNYTVVFSYKQSTLRPPEVHICTIHLINVNAQFVWHLWGLMICMPCTWGQK